MIGFNSPVTLTDITLSPIRHQLAGDRLNRLPGKYQLPRLHDSRRQVGVSYSAINTNPGLRAHKYVRPFPLKYTVSVKPTEEMSIEPMPRPYRGGALSSRPYFTPKKFNPIFSKDIILSIQPKTKPYMALHTVPKI